MDKAIPYAGFDGDAEERARSIVQDMRELDADVNSFRTNTIADYVQLNAATTAGLSVVSGLREYVYAIPYTITQSFEVSGFSLEADTWTLIIDQPVYIPAETTHFTLMASMSVNMTTDFADNPSVWFSFFPGINPGIEAPLTNSVHTRPDGSQYRTRTGHASGSAPFSFPSRGGGEGVVRLRLWSDSAVTLGGEAALTYVLIAGGQP